MNQEEVKEKFTAIVRDILDDDTLVFQRETKAKDVEDWDSLAHISIIVAVEKQFNVKFDLYELKPLKNIGEMLDLIQAKTQA